LDPSILIFDTAQTAAEACGDRTLELLDQGRRERGVATVALSGGSTPRLMFQSMARRNFDWAGVQFFQVDERCVQPDDQQSNFRMIRESQLESGKIPASQFHRVQGELPPADAARIYEDEIRRTLNIPPGELPEFDVIQRGMGPDGHTASLFPGEPLISDQTGIAAAVWVEKMKQHRVTLLPGVLERARHTLCLVTGPEKADALFAVLRPWGSDGDSFPDRLAGYGLVHRQKRRREALKRLLFDPPRENGRAGVEALLSAEVRSVPVDAQRILSHELQRQLTLGAA
jgi:6-phosphogluconolactonase